MDTFHFGAGFEGQFGLFDRNWSWDANYQYNRNEENDVTNGLVNIPNLIAGVSADCGIDNNGVPCLDVFHGPGATFTPEMARAISFVAHDAFEYEQWNYTANLTGDIFELPAGPLGFAAGYEYRREQGFDSPDALISSGASSGNIRQPTSSHSCKWIASVGQVYGSRQTALPCGGVNSTSSRNAGDVRTRSTPTPGYSTRPRSTNPSASGSVAGKSV